jgi:VWFA-related protein
MHNRQLRPRFLAILTIVVTTLATAGFVPAQEPQLPTFRTSVAIVPITAVVRDSRHRLVRNLAREDFQVLEHGTPRRIIEFRANDDGPVSVAFLFDTSGSMGLTANLAKGKDIIRQLLARLDSTRDEVALFTFHKSLREEVPFTSDVQQIERALGGVRPWGLTSLYDAVAETAKRITDRSGARRAVVVISDGLDTSSALTSTEVAALASAIDVPVYVVGVVSPLDHPAHAASVVPPTSTGGLLDLAELTGGDVFYVSSLEPSPTADALLMAMRHQYFLAIESSTTPGQYALEVKMKRKGLNVRARSGYLAESTGERPSEHVSMR